MRYNPASRAGSSRAEQAAYAEGHERIFGGRGETRITTTRPTAITRRSSSSGKGQTPAQKRARRREAAYRQAVGKGLSKTDAARRAMRAVPFTKTQKRAGVHYKGMTVYAGRGSSAKRGEPRQWAVGSATRRKKVTRTVKVRKRERVAYGRYRRLRVTDPRTGRKRLSYLYTTKSGKRRHIPMRAIATYRGRGAKGFKGAAKAAMKIEQIKRARERAAAGLSRRGGAFTANRKPRRKKMRANVSAKRRAAGKKAWRTRLRRAAVRAKGVGRGRGLKGTHLRAHRVYYRGRKPRSLRGVRARKLPRARILLTNRRRRVHRRRRHANRAQTPNRRRRRRIHRRRRHAVAATPNRRRRSRRRMRRNARGAYAENRRRRTRRRRRHANAATPNRRHRRRRHRRNGRGAFTANRRRRHHRHGRRGYRRNAGFWSAFMALAQAALFVTVGFLAGKVLTRLLSDKVLAPALAGQSSLAQLVPYSPIIAGVPITLAGVFGAISLAPKQAPEVGGGLIAAFLHTALVTVMQAIGGDAATYAGYLAGVDTRSSAAAIGRHWTQDVRGLGWAQQRGIGPRYRQLGPRGGLRQAVAGQLGEYISADGVGEYFASGVQGIGSYEQAGPMVTQAAAGLGQNIDDGVRPDGNLDNMFELMEAQAGVGEYFAARRNAAGETVEYTVGQRNTWIPGEGGPLWSGTARAGDAQSTSEIPAGILETAGGNGVFG